MWHDGSVSDTPAQEIPLVDSTANPLSNAVNSRDNLRTPSTPPAQPMSLKRRGRPKGAKDVKKRHRRIHAREITPDLEKSIGDMAAVGVGTHQIRDTLHLGYGTVTDVLARPHVIEYVTQLRDRIRGITLARIAEQQEHIMKWVGETVKERDARAFDAVTRGVHALEKTASSASGEARRIEAAVVGVHVDATEEGKQLITALMGDG